MMQIIEDLGAVRQRLINVSLRQVDSSGFALEVTTLGGVMPTLWVRCLFDDDAWYIIDGVNDYWEVMGNDSLPEVYRRQLRV